MLTGSLVVSIASEVAFTLYFGVTDTANLVGHLLKIVAFYILYLALVETAFNRPYDLLFRQLKQEEENQRTGRTQAEAALGESERKYRRLVDTALVCVYQTDLEGNILFANPEMAHMLHYASSQELMGAKITKFYKNPYDHLRLIEILQKDKQARNIEADLVTRDGQICSVLVSASLEGNTLSGMMRDVTENKRAEKEINLHVQRLHALREIDLAIMGSANVHISLQTALDQAVSQLGIDAADILVFNPQTQRLKYLLGRGFYSKEIELSELMIGQGVAGRAALRQETQHIADITKAGQEFIRAALIKDEAFIEYYAVPLTAKGGTVGVLEIFNRQPLTPDANWLDFLHALAGQAAIAIDNNQLLSNLQRANVDLLHAYDATIKGWSHALDLRDKETEGHTLRVAEMTVKLAQEAGLSEEEIINIQRGSLLHDIGKMGIPDQILLKPDKLTEEEWEIMRKHPQFAFDMLAPITYLRSALDIPYCHHEKWDGSGYPRGLKGNQIPLSARLFAVVDVWDALCSDRPYRRGWGEEKVLEHIRSLSGTHFDPEAVNLFLKVIQNKSAS
jgi:PAS domain S-box-containing protein